VPNLDFYAFDTDRQAVLEAVFSLDLFRVFERASQPDSDVREFRGADAVDAASEVAFLMLYPVGAGPEPVMRRIELTPGAIPGAAYRHECDGWGLITLLFGDFYQGRELRWSRTNHNSAARAAKWASATSHMGSPDAWDFKAVAQASGKLNRAIGKRAVEKIGSHPILPAAATLIHECGLDYEAGLGLRNRASD
jgi:hypothetical protein